MEVYDYSKQKDLEKEILSEIEQMSPSDMKEMLSVTVNARLEKENQKQRQKERWYENVLLPVLKDFAASEGLILEVAREDMIYTASMRSDFSIDILQSCTGIRLALMLSECIEILQGETCCLTLIHNCEGLPEWPL